MALADQHLPGLGTSLGPIDAGHTDLTTSFPHAAVGRRYRKALVQCVVMAVGLPSAEIQPGRPGSHVVARPILP